MQRGAGKTGKSWLHLHDYLASHHPDAFLIENVPALAQAANESGDTDAAYITKELAKMGYGTVVEFTTSAADYGSRTARKRLYWLAVLSSKPELANTIASIIEASKIHNREFIPMHDFWLDTSCRELANAPAGDDGPGSLGKQEFLYKQEHMDAFDEASLEWPAPRTGDTAIQSCLNLDQRAYDVVYFAHHCFPYSPKQGSLHAEFLDSCGVNSKSTPLVCGRLGFHIPGLCGFQCDAAVVFTKVV